MYSFFLYFFKYYLILYMKEFKIKFVRTGMHFCLINTEDNYIHTKYGLAERLKNEFYHNNKVCNHYNKLEDKSELDKIVAMSSIAEPLVFYLDGKYIRCSKTNKYLSCLSNERIMCGGAPVFLSSQVEFAIEFDVANITTNPTEEKVLWVEKSLVYPKNYKNNVGRFTGPALIRTASNAWCEAGPFIVYHNPGNRESFTITKNVGPRRVDCYVVIEHI